MMPETVSNYLHRRGVEFEVVVHDPTATAQETAHAVHIPGDRIAKAVVLEDGDDFLLAVIPATHRLTHWAITTAAKRPVYLAEEDDFALLFRDCKKGAIPPLGNAYGIRTIVDFALLEQPDIYFESGDHERLVHVDASGFARLMSGSVRAPISRHV